jgi:hypothetical protein
MIRVDVAKWGQTTEDLRLASVHAAHPRSRERFQALYLIASGRFKEQGHALRARGGSLGRAYRMPVKAYRSKHNSGILKPVCLGGECMRSCDAAELGCGRFGRVHYQTLRIHVLGVAFGGEGRTMSASTKPAKNHPMVFSKIWASVKSVGNPYQFQYGTCVMIEARIPTSVTHATRPMKPVRSCETRIAAKSAQTTLVPSSIGSRLLRDASRPFG